LGVLFFWSFSCNYRVIFLMRCLRLVATLAGAEMMTSDASVLDYLDNLSFDGFQERFAAGVFRWV